MGHFKCEHSDGNKFRPKDHVLMGAKVGLAPNKIYQVGVSPKGGPNVPRTFPVPGCKTSFFLLFSQKCLSEPPAPSK